MQWATNSGSPFCLLGYGGISGRFWPYLVGCTVLILLVEGFLFYWLARFLIAERRTTPGKTFVVEGYGDLSILTESKLVRRFFKGRRQLTRVYHISPAGILGRDSCPVWLAPGE